MQRFAYGDGAWLIRHRREGRKSDDFIAPAGPGPAHLLPTSYNTKFTSILPSNVSLSTVVRLRGIRSLRSPRKVTPTTAQTIGGAHLHCPRLCQTRPVKWLKPCRVVEVSFYRCQVLPYCAALYICESQLRRCCLPSFLSSLHSFSSCLKSGTQSCQASMPIRPS